MPMIRTAMGNQSCGSVTTARVRDCFRFSMFVVELLTEGKLKHAPPNSQAKLCLT